MQKYKILIFISIAVVILDQLTKAIITHYISLHQSIEVIGGFFNITHVRNPGAAFSLFRDSNEIFRTLFLIGVSMVALIVVFFVYRKIENNLPYRIAMSLIAGGAVGNLIDRIQFGEVIDFLDVYIGRYHWPAFNVADSAITTGVFIAVFSLYGSKNGLFS
ncbi:MAG: signal peptidase II [Deltaproteobacteria bacterium]|nr:signal peptidase II [Deltaproteobacteria bacterium]